MRVAGIVRDSIVDGEGVRDAIFLQGCDHHCIGCHNQQTWATMGGYEMTTEALVKELSNSNNNITISGGEPLLQYQELLDFMQAIAKDTDKRFWLYTGFRYEEIPRGMWEELVKYVDVVVDGRFDITKRDKNLYFRGSSNQRLIDLKRTLEYRRIVNYIPMEVLYDE